MIDENKWWLPKETSIGNSSNGASLLKMQLSQEEQQAQLQFQLNLMQNKLPMIPTQPQGLNVDKMFAYQHLPAEKQVISKMFYDCAKAFDEATPFNAEKTLTLRKLWEAKNLAVLANSDWK